MAGMTLAITMTERMHRDLAEYAALLSVKPRRSGGTRPVSVEDALLLAAMLYIDDCLYRQRQAAPTGGVAPSPPGSREGPGVGP